jgi:hypothetical protein
MALHYLPFRRLRRQGAEDKQQQAGRQFRVFVHKPASIIAR